ncbi:MAG: hypothetical protein RJA07_2311 [Bacteroidota bacterium]|jgi:hypothetical protein
MKINHHFIMKKYLLFIGVLILGITALKAQPLQTLGFENNSFVGWNCYVGNCCPINTNILGVVANRHSITSGTAIDSFGNFPMVCPNGGLHSFKLGNDSAGAQAEKATFNYFVDTNAYYLTVAYAAVLKLAGHTASTSSRFYFRVKDNLGNDIFNSSQCAYCNANPYPSNLQISTKDTSVKYLPWTNQILNLHNYVGKTVTFEIISGDDSSGNEFGYGYFDVISSGNLEPKEVYCMGNNALTLNAPANYSYSWYYAKTGAFRGSNAPLTVSNLILGDSFDIVLNPLAIGNGIVDTVRYYLKLIPHPIPHGGFTTSALCSNQAIQFTDTANYNQNLLNVIWNFGDINSPNNQSTLFSPNHQFSAAGNFTIVQTVTNNFGCSNAFVNTINVYSPPIANAGADDSVCIVQAKILGANPTATNGSGNYSYSWASNGSISQTNIANPTAWFNVASNAIVTVVDNVSHCSSSDTIYISLANNCFNHAPIANDDTFYITAPQTKIFDVLLNDIDNDGANLLQGNLTTSVLSLMQMPIHGTAQLVAGNTKILYKPNGAYVGADTIKYTLNDGATQNNISNMANIVIHVSDTLKIVLPSSISLCLGNNITPANFSYIGGSSASNFLYSWQPTQSITCTTCATPNFHPTATTTYTISVTDTLTKNVVIDSLIIIVNKAAISLGNDTFITFNHPTLQLAATNLGNSAIQFYSWSPAASCGNCASSSFTFSNTTLVTITTTDFNNCIASDSVLVTACSNNCVWPGDADEDLTANNFDIFNVGLGYRYVGNNRFIAATNWDGFPCNDWVDTVANGLNAKFADCNGDGIIDDSDVNAIDINYSKNHLRLGGSKSPKALPLVINLPAGPFQNLSHFNCDIALGTSVIKGDSIYGVAFTFNFDPLVVDTNTIQFNAFNNWMFAHNGDNLEIQKNFKSAGKVEIGLVRKNHIGKSGFGSIGGMSIDIVTGNIAGKINGYMKNYILKCSVDNIRVIDFHGKIIQSVGSSDSTYIEYKPNGINELEWSNNIALLPNPAHTNFSIIATGDIFIKQIRIVNLLGENMHQLEFGNSTAQKQINIPLQNFAQGVYMIGIETNKGTTIKRLVVER